MSIAICFPLSWKLLIYALETLFVASDKTPVHPVNQQVPYTARHEHTRQGALSTPCEARVERAGTRIYPRQRVSIFCPQLTVV
jgi:hypothetical protein